ncbi:MAG: hypothetical protein M5U26_11180 [Planctomycetota bacterium]|nr:hypothetical protein [Planctomycetota bacterium]
MRHDGQDKPLLLLHATLDVGEDFTRQHPTQHDQEQAEQGHEGQTDLRGERETAPRRYWFGSHGQGASLREKDRHLITATRFPRFIRHEHIC